MASREIDQGYEDNRFENLVSRNFHCLICLSVLKEPVMCRRNQHYFCTPCITRHLGNSSTCPSCLEELTVETLSQVPRIVTECLSELNIRCNYFSRGCRELVQLGNLETHVANCGFSPVKCSNDGCGMVLNKQDKTHHVAEVCDFRKLKCHDCAELRREVVEMKVNLVEMKVNMTTAMKEQIETQSSQSDKFIKCVNEMKVDMAQMKVDMAAAMKEQIETQSDKFIKCVNEMQDGIMREVRGMRGEIKYLKDEIQREIRTVQEPRLSKEKEDIIIAGGGKGSTKKKSVESFSWSKRSWARLNPMKKCRSRAASFVYENQMVVTGGWSADGSTDSIEMMDIEDEPKQWIDFPANLPEKSYGHNVVCYKDRLIVIGGRDENAISDAIHEMLLVPPYSKKLLSRMAHPVDLHGVELLKNKMFIVGGSRYIMFFLHNHNTNSVMMYDINKNECKEMSPLPYAVSEMATVIWKDNVVVIGGMGQDGNSLNTVIMYDVITERRQVLPCMIYKRRACTAVITCDVIVVMGGIDEKDNSLNAVECFDLNRQIWEELPPMIEPRAYATAVVKLS